MQTGYGSSTNVPSVAARNGQTEVTGQGSLMLELGDDSIGQFGPTAAAGFGRFLRGLRPLPFLG